MDSSSTLIASQSPSRKRPRELTMSSSSISENYKSVPTTVKSSPTSNKPYANGSTSSSLNGFPSSSSASSYVSIMDDHRNGSAETGKLSPTSNDADYMVSKMTFTFFISILADDFQFLINRIAINNLPCRAFRIN